MKNPLAPTPPPAALSRPRHRRGAAGRGVPRAGSEAPEPALTDPVVPEAESGCPVSGASGLRLLLQYGQSHGAGWAAAGARGGARRAGEHQPPPRRPANRGRAGAVRLGAGGRRRPRGLAVAAAAAGPHVPSAAAAGAQPLPAGARRRLLGGAGLRAAAGRLPQVSGGGAGVLQRRPGDRSSRLRAPPAPVLPRQVLRVHVRAFPVADVGPQAAGCPSGARAVPAAGGDRGGGPWL